MKGERSLGIFTRLGGLNGLGLGDGSEDQQREEYGRAKKPDLSNWALRGAVLRVDGRYWHAEVSAGWGRNLEDISEFLKESPKIPQKVDVSALQSKKNRKCGANRGQMVDKGGLWGT